MSVRRNRSFIASVSNVETTKDTLEATLIQTRHRIPEEKLKSNQILIFQ
ncbi:alpha-D-ribose 1-methylphosphonate 5-phosphate C-P-lyase PhnJ, partial [Clostridioides difficile]